MVRSRVSCSLLVAIAGALGASADPVVHPWPDRDGQPLEERVVPPPGCARVALEPESFGAWLRRLPLRPGRPPVHLHDGRLKGNQEAHAAVVAIDVGRGNLQQCADAVIRLRAEWLWSRGCEEAIAFQFTSGDLARWLAWKDGVRPRVSGSRVAWVSTARPDGTYESFRRYLDTVFAYAGSLSLARELERVPDPRQVEPGDVFVQGGSPGHAVLVVDVATDAHGARWFLLVQSYMPAQEVHLLRHPATPGSPWYRAAASGELVTPEWTFRVTDLRRFPPVECGG
ncbi:MAG: DUF4846 domain-containing protein [Thermoanaerobaculaceae bacterium]